MAFFSTLKADFRAAYDRDPAANGFGGVLAILLCYPGVKAVWAYRFLHRVHGLGLKLPARVLSQTVRFFTGTEIHPGARIGPGFFIDHASGVVIGETTIVGSNVTLYQQVTLGGTGKETGKRHPTLEDDVVVGAGAKVLGNVTLGEGSKVGAGSVVVRDVPPHCTVIGVPAVVVRRGCAPVDLDHTNIPDPFTRRLEELQAEFETLHEELESTRRELAGYKSRASQQVAEYEIAGEELH